MFEFSTGILVSALPCIMVAGQTTPFKEMESRLTPTLFLHIKRRSRLLKYNGIQY